MLTGFRFFLQKSRKSDFVFLASILDVVSWEAITPLQSVSADITAVAFSVVVYLYTAFVWSPQRYSQARNQASSISKESYPGRSSDGIKER
jgi:hypothetical protein